MSNPAGRLDSLLGKATATGSHQRYQNGAARAVWAAVLDLDPQSADFLEAYAKLSRLIEQTRRIAKRLNIGQSQESQLNSLRQALDPSMLNQPWPTAAKAIEPSIRVYLSMASDVLDRLAPEADLEEEVVSSLAADLQALIEEVEVSKIDASLRDFLLRQMEKCRQALIDHRFDGASAAREAVESVIGALVVPPESVAPASARETESFKSFWMWLSRLSQFLGLAKRLDELSSGSGIGGLLGQ